MNWISVDPGKSSGMVSWKGRTPVAWEQAAAPSRMAFVDWLPFVVNSVQDFGERHRAQAVAVERPFIDPEKPAPELNALVRAFGTMARQRKWGHHFYPASQVLASVRPRGCGKMRSREAMRLGVGMLYGEQTRELSHDVIAAFAVGHCHLSRIREEEVLKHEQSLR